MLFVPQKVLDRHIIMSITSSQIEALQFQLKHIGGIENLSASQLYSHADSETVQMMLEQAARFTQEYLEPLASSGDIAGCRLVDGAVQLPDGTKEAWQHWCALGFPALSLPPEHDGLGLPRVVQCAVQEISDGANMAFGMLGINLRCAALALMKNTGTEHAQQYIPGLVSGELASTIAISEPQAGSDVGRILTSAQPQSDGSYKLTGSKIWISYADHNATSEIIHLVLARIPGGEAGTRGLGLFLVPANKNTAGKQTNGISILRLEHKMGLHASPTCVMELNGALGHLIGEAGKGLQALFVMMNAMRLAVAVQGAAVANVSALHAIQYALERPQGGSSKAAPLMIASHADVRRMLLEMTAHGELARALALRTASMLDKAETDPDSSNNTWLALGEMLLPLAKTLNAETAFEVASQGIQVLGGYGYTSDYPLERLARDIRVAAIYEGTSGIQALDFLKRRVLADKGVTIGLLLQLVRKACAKGSSPFSVVANPVCAALEATLQYFLDPATNGSEAGAYALLKLTGTVVNIWNGHSLYCAVSGSSAYEKRLCAALEYYAGTSADQAGLWAVKARQELPDYQFQ